MYLICSRYFFHFIRSKIQKRILAQNFLQFIWYYYKMFDQYKCTFTDSIKLCPIIIIVNTIRVNNKAKFQNIFDFV